MSKNVGIVRRLDNLGRVTIPMEMRKSLGIENRGEVEISACFVNAGCKIGYIRLCMRPHLQPAFPCLAGFFSVWQSVDFVNILTVRSIFVIGRFQ